MANNIFLNNAKYSSDPNYDIVSLDSHSERLDRVLAKQGVVIEAAVGIDIQNDVLAIAKKDSDI